MRLPEGVTAHDVVWMANKCRPNVDNTLANLRNVPGKPYWPSGRFDGDVALVGAGPSLTGTLERGDLDRAEFILAVNTAVPALLAAGVTPDAVLVRECLDLRGHLDGLPERTKVVADIGAHPSAFERADGWYLSMYPRHLEMAHWLGVTPTDAGPSALTAAVGMMHAMGASGFVLYGVDLAATGGLAYAERAAWGGARGRYEGGVLHFEGAEHIRQANESQGQQTSLPDRLMAEMVPGWGGGPDVPTMHTWQEQREWLAEWAGRVPGYYTNATGGGGTIDGWKDRIPPSEAVWGHLSSVGVAFTAKAVDVYFGELRRQCETLRAICRQFLVEATPQGLAFIPGIVEGAHFAEVWAAPDLMEARQYGGAARMRKTYEAMDAAAVHVLEALG